MSIRNRALVALSLSLLQDVPLVVLHYRNLTPAAKVFVASQEITVDHHHGTLPCPHSDCKISETAIVESLVLTIGSVCISANHHHIILNIITALPEILAPYASCADIQVYHLLRLC